MRSRTPKTVFTFATTGNAMAMEGAAKEHGLPGRMIPVPSQISAGCGLAWCAEVGQRAVLEDALERYNLSCEGVFTVELY